MRQSSPGPFSFSPSLSFRTNFGVASAVHLHLDFFFLDFEATFQRRNWDYDQTTGIGYDTQRPDSGTRKHSQVSPRYSSALPCNDRKAKKSSDDGSLEDKPRAFDRPDLLQRSYSQAFPRRGVATKPLADRPQTFSVTFFLASRQPPFATISSLRTLILSRLRLSPCPGSR